MSSDPNLQAAFKQIVKLWVVLQRPILQRQLMAFALAALLAWFLANQLWRLLGYRLARRADRRLNEKGQWYALAQRGLLFVEYATYPVLGFLTVKIANVLFLAQGWRAELLVDLGGLFAFILYYRLLLALLTIGPFYGLW